MSCVDAHLAEFGIVAGVGRNGLERLLTFIENGEGDCVPPTARECLLALRDQLEMVKHQILDGDRRILAWHRSSEVSQRLDDIPGIGPLIATALVASVPDPHAFKSGRDLAAWIPDMTLQELYERLSKVHAIRAPKSTIDDWLRSPAPKTGSP